MNSRIKLIMFIIILVLSAGGIRFFIDQQASFRKNVEDRLMDIAHLKAAQIVIWREYRMAEGVTLMNRTDLIEAVGDYFRKQTPKNKKNILRILTPVKERYQFADIIVASPDKQIYFGIDSLEKPHNRFYERMNETFDTHTPLWFDLHIEHTNPFPHFSLITPLFLQDSPSIPLGALVMVIDAKQHLFPLIQTWPEKSRTAETLLVRREGENVLFLNELRHRKGTALKLKLPLDRTELPAAMAVSGKYGVVRGKDYRGIDVVAAVMPIPDSAWFIVAKMDADEAFKDWRFRSIMIVVLITGAFVFILGIGFAVNQRNNKLYFKALYFSEAALRESVEKYAVTLRAVGDAVISTDDRGYIEFVNPVAETLTGWSHAEASGKPLTKIFHIINEDTRKHAPDPVRKIIKDGRSIGLANHTLLIDRQGREIPIADSGAPIKDDMGRVTGVVLVFRDQTVERRTERITALRFQLMEYASEHSLDELIQKLLGELAALTGSPAGFYLLNQQGDRLIRKCIWFGGSDWMSEPAPVETWEPWLVCLHDKTTVIENDILEPLPDGRNISGKVMAPVLRDNIVTAVAGLFNKPEGYSNADGEMVSEIADLTWEIISQKKTEETLRINEEALKKAQRLSHVGNWIWDIMENSVTWSDEMFRIFGYDKNDFKGDLNKIIETAIHPDDRGKVMQSNQTVIQDKNAVPLEYRVIRPDGTIRTVWAEAGELICDKTGNPIRLTGIVQDITQRKNDEMRIQNALDEKEVLIRELYHRTKNNMQIISSMLRLKSRVMPDENLRTMVADIENKIQSMALVHKKLYESQNLDSLDLKSYLKDLVTLIGKSYIHRLSNIGLEFEGEQVVVSIDTATPLGIVINELMTNAIKHAFPEGRKGRIWIKLAKTAGEETITIDINDNGIGFPKGFNIEKNSNLGLDTVIDLVRNQLAGEIKCRSSKGVHWRIVIKNSDESGDSHQ
ncbi:PAS domain S-box protein [bacterium]|nr:PAS domain S-box protein [bacterium]